MSSNSFSLCMFLGRVLVVLSLLAALVAGSVLSEVASSSSLVEHSSHSSHSSLSSSKSSPKATVVLPLYSKGLSNPASGVIRASISLTVVALSISYTVLKGRVLACLSCLRMKQSRAALRL